MGFGFSFLLRIKFIIGVEMSKSWYVLNSYSGYENKAKEQLLERIERENLHEFFGGIEVPTQTITEIKAGKEKVTEKKFFPGYVLIKIELTKEIYHMIKNLKKVFYEYIEKGVCIIMANHQEELDERVKIHLENNV